MSFRILALLTAMFLCSCASQPTERVVSAPKRELASAEKASLATTLFLRASVRIARHSLLKPGVIRWSAITDAIGFCVGIGGRLTTAADVFACDHRRYPRKQIVCEFWRVRRTRGQSKRESPSFPKVKATA